MTRPVGNDNSDGKENGQKAIIGLDLYNNFARASYAFVYISLPWLHDDDEHKTTIFFFFFVNLDAVLKKSTPEEIVNIWQIKRVGKRAMKFETARIPLLRDIFVAVRRRSCLSPLMRELTHGPYTMVSTITD